MQNPNNVSIRYSDGKQKIGTHSKEKINKNTIDDLSKIRELRVISIIVFTISLFIFFSLISYTSTDNTFTNISLKEILSNIINPKNISSNAEISNWLGIIGAIISDFLINSTIGYSTLLLPIFLILAAKNLFFQLSLKNSLLRLFTVYLILAFCFSGTMATIAISGIIQNLPNEWYGITGYFIASIFVRFIGIVGTFVIFIAISSITIIIGTNLNVDKILKKFQIILKVFAEFLIITTLKIPQLFKKSNIQKEENEITKESINEEVTPDKTEFFEEDEPAKVIRRNLNISINKIEYDSSNAITNSFETDKIIIRHIKPGPENTDQSSIQTIENKNHNTSAIINYKKKYVHKDPIKELNQTGNDDLKLNTKIDNPRNISPIIDTLPTKNIFESKENILQNESQDLVENNQQNLNNISIENETNDIEKNSSFTFEKENHIEDSKSLTLTVHTIKSEKISTSVDNTFINQSHYNEEIEYTPPPTTILIQKNEENYIDEEELQRNATILQEKLETFKIYIENLSVTPGPVVTQYEFIPAAGIKISKIESLADDLAMALKARGIRIIAPIPGKGTVGIEIPNQKPTIVRFSSIVCSQKFRETNYKLPLALGKTISGEVYITDLAKMPHLLIAGATGAGKSVGINTIIASLIYKIHPRELKFVIIDPKKVELNQYSKLENHFLAKSPDIDDVIITNPKDAVLVLNSVVAEMENRYDLLAMVGQRNINDFNEKLIAGKINHSQASQLKPMPYIVVIIDELADLMMTAAKEIEEPITRLAQMARAVGIHLVVATQRPSVDVITGIIKANFPARIAYLVAQKVDSRTILDVMGAEQLLGNGDMLFLPSGSPKPIRLQNSFISSDEVDEICNFIARQKGYTTPYLLPSLIDKRSNSINGSNFDRDPLFEEAARLVVRHQQGSASLIQRRLKVGYARAGRIIDELEAAGIIGPYEGSKARQVLIETEAQLDAIL